MSTLPELEHDERRRSRSRPPKLTTSDYAIGICLLFVVVILWTLSNFVTQVDPPADRLGITDNSLVYVCWWKLQETLYVRSGFPDCLRALTEWQDNVSEHGFLHALSVARLSAGVIRGHYVSESAEEYQVSTLHRPTSHKLLTGNPQLPAFNSRRVQRT